MSAVAQVGIGLRDAGFSAGLAGLVAKTKTAGTAMGAAVAGPLQRGMMAAGGHLRTGIASAMNFAGGLGGLGAAMGVTALINDAAQADKKFRTLANTMSMANKGVGNFAKIQQQAHDVTNKWGASSEELADSVRAIYADTGDAAGAIGAMEHVAMISRATGLGVNDVSSLIGGLNEQFGVTTDQIDDTVASLLELSSKGGVSIGDVSSGMAEMARAAKLAGVEGPAGLKQIIALSNQLEGAAGGGQQAIALMTGTLSKLAANPALHKELKQKFGIDAEGKDAVSILGAVLEKNKGNEVQALGQIFKAGDAVKLAQGLGGGGFAEAMRSSSTTKTGADLRGMADDMMKSPAAQMELALNKLRMAFSQPKVIDSLTKLAGVLPPVVDGFAKLVEFIAEHQTAIGGALVVGALAKFASSLGGATTAAETAAKVLGGLGGAGGPGGGGAAPTLAIAAAAAGVGLALDQGEKLRRELAEGGVPGQLGLDASLKDNAARWAVEGNPNEVEASTFTDEHGNEHYLAPYFDKETGKSGAYDLSAVGGTESDFATPFGVSEDLMLESAQATRQARQDRADYEGMHRGAGVLGSYLGQRGVFDGLMGKLPFMGGGGSTMKSSGPAEVKTPELVGLLRGGIVVSLNPASADAIGAAVAGKMPMPQVRTGVDDHG